MQDESEKSKTLSENKLKMVLNTAIDRKCLKVMVIAFIRCGGS